MTVMLLVPLAENAEFVAFRIGKYDPGLFALTDVNMLRTVGHEAGNLGFLVIGPEVKVKSTLACPALVDSDEIQPRLAIRFRADLEFLASGVDHDPPESFSPPFAKGYRVQRVDDHLFPFQNHQLSLSACTVPAIDINPHRCPGHPPLAIGYRAWQSATPQKPRCCPQTGE